MQFCTHKKKMNSHESLMFSIKLGHKRVFDQKWTSLYRRLSFTPSPLSPHHPHSLVCSPHSPYHTQFCTLTPNRSDQHTTQQNTIINNSRTYILTSHHCDCRRMWAITNIPHPYFYLYLYVWGSRRQGTLWCDANTWMWITAVFDESVCVCDGSLRHRSVSRVLNPHPFSQSLRKPYHIHIVHACQSKVFAQSPRWY